MITITLEKARGLPRTNQIDDILSKYRLVDLAIIKHVQQDFPLLTTLAERWDPTCYSFHLPLGEMTITLMDIYHI